MSKRTYAITDFNSPESIHQINNHYEVTNDFPIDCSSKEEAIETLKKILED